MKTTNSFGVATVFVSCLLFASCQKPAEAQWVSTTFDAPWIEEQLVRSSGADGEANVIIDVSRTAQTIDGFGTCFNELGWTSLAKLQEAQRDSIMRELFAPGVGANFTICRMPIAANDFSIDYYSYDEVEGDFSMEHFSIEHDRSTLIPFIKLAQQQKPDLKIWASPWCPPAWMKYSKHYASRSTVKMKERLASLLQEGESTYMFRVVDNGLPADKEIHEGNNGFIQEDAYFRAYALYFSKFIDAYRAEGIDIFMVMPQNEFNSAQIFPSCCWTAEGLNTFIGKYLGPAMKEKGVEVFYGTVERANVALVDTVLQDSDSKQYINGVGFQWAGKDALPQVAEKYPSMKLYQTEQECGNGKNDWAGAEHSWNLMKHYMKHGVNVYTYWNTSLLQGGISRWGWAQNSLVVVDEDDASYRYTPEYYVMKHVSHYVQPGAKRIETGGTYEDVLAFLNPDGSVAVIAGNNTDTERTVGFSVQGKKFAPSLKAHSINTFVF